MTSRWSLLLLAGLVPLNAFAASTVRSPNAASTVVQSETTASALDPIARARAELWGLSPVEWHRYESLMTGIRGSISPSSISPIEVLGIHARDEGERRKYAERWARLMREDVDRILAFQRAYDEAGRRLYPNEQIIAEIPGQTTAPVAARLNQNDRLLLFTAPNCAPCDALLQGVLAKIDRLAGIDIYLSQIAPDDTAGVRTWATRHGIAPAWVKSGRVTLNFEAGTLAKLGKANATLPVLLRRRGEAITPVARTELR